MNYDEVSDDDDDDDDNDDADRGGSLFSPNTESTRPASASSTKSSTVSLYTHSNTQTGCCFIDAL